MPKRSQRLESSQLQKRRNSQVSGSSAAPERGADDTRARVSACVRYVLLRAASGAVLKRNEMKKTIFANTDLTTFNNAFNKAAKVLMEVYGYKLEVCDSKQGLTYTIHNNLPYMRLNLPDESETKKDHLKILTLLILTQIFMLHNKCSEGMLLNFLKSLKIEMDVRHPLFGNVSTHITSLVKQKMINKEVDTTTKQTMYQWGPKAESSVSKKQICDFVATYYKSCMERGSAYLKEAQEQEQLNQQDDMIE